jgi:hypothetical protein
MPPKQKQPRRKLRRPKPVVPAPGHLDIVVGVIERLAALDLQPVLVGGMALVLLGSRRVTRDFDFVIEQPGERLAAAVDVFYDRRLELAAKINSAGDVIATIGNRRIAASRLRLDQPNSAFFFDRNTGLRIDVLMDFPTPARQLAGRSIKAKTPHGTLPLASEQDLLELKLIAQQNRALASDAQDVSFLQNRRRERTDEEPD